MAQRLADHEDASQIDSRCNAMKSVQRWGYFSASIGILIGKDPERWSWRMAHRRDVGWPIPVPSTVKPAKFVSENRSWAGYLSFRINDLAAVTGTRKRHKKSSFSGVFVGDGAMGSDPIQPRPAEPPRLLLPQSVTQYSRVPRPFVRQFHFASAGHAYLQSYIHSKK